MTFRKLMAKERPNTPSGRVSNMWWWMLLLTSISLLMRPWKLCHSSRTMPCWLGLNPKPSCTCIALSLTTLNTLCTSSGIHLMPEAIKKCCSNSRHPNLLTTAPALLWLSAKLALAESHIIFDPFPRRHSPSYFWGAITIPQSSLWCCWMVRFHHSDVPEEIIPSARSLGECCVPAFRPAAPQRQASWKLQHWRPQTWNRGTVIHVDGKRRKKFGVTPSVTFRATIFLRNTKSQYLDLERSSWLEGEVSLGLVPDWWSVLYTLLLQKIVTRQNGKPFDLRNLIKKTDINFRRLYFFNSVNATCVPISGLRMVPASIMWLCFKFHTILRICKPCVWFPRDWQRFKGTVQFQFVTAADQNYLLTTLTFQMMTFCKKPVQEPA